jgi:hypothetical protein
MGSRRSNREYDRGEERGYWSRPFHRRRDLGWNVAVAVLEGVEVPCSKDQGSREVEEEVGHAESQLPI